MRKIFVPVILVAVIISLASCGANRKLGCPSTAKSAGHSKNINS